MAASKAAPAGLAAPIAEANEALLEQLVTAEELERLTVAEGVGDLDRARLYLAGEPFQQLCLLHNLSGVVRGTGAAAFAALAAPLAAVVLGGGAQDEEGLQAAAADALGALCSARLLPPGDVGEHVLPLALACLARPDAAPALQDAWLGCLGEAAAAAEAAALGAHVLPVALQRAAAAGGGAAARSRCLACRLLGALAPHLPREPAVEARLLKASAALCQDTEWQVRQATCQQLPALAQAVQREALTGPLLSELCWLLEEEEEPLVRAAAWGALAEVLPLLPVEAAQRVILPLFLRQCGAPDRHPEVQRALAAAFGVLVGQLVAHMDGEADVAASMGAYRGLAWQHDAVARQHCAAALPLVLRAATPRRYGAHLHETLVRLAGDSKPGVRAALAAALPQVAAALRERGAASQYLAPSLGALLGDGTPEVAANALEALPAVLEQFQGAGEEARAAACAPLVEPLLRVEAGAGPGWRSVAAVLCALPRLACCLPPEPLFERLLPLAWRYLRGEGADALRAPAAEGVVEVWRALRRPVQRAGLYARMVRECAQGRSYRERLAFLELSAAALRCFSTRFFKAHLLEPCLTLAYDPVPAVRLRLAALMPALKRAVALPDDVSLLERLNSAMSHLITDGQADVSQAARRAYDEYKRLPVRMSCGALESSAPEVKAHEAADAALAAAERDSFVLDHELVDRVRGEIDAYDRTLRPAPHTRSALDLGHSGRTDTSGGGSSNGGRHGSTRGPGRAGVAAAAAAGRPGVSQQRVASDPADRRTGAGGRGSRGQSPLLSHPAQVRRAVSDHPDRPNLPGAAAAAAAGPPRPVRPGGGLASSSGRLGPGGAVSASGADAMVLQQHHHHQQQQQPQLGLTDRLKRATLSGHEPEEPDDEYTGTATGISAVDGSSGPRTSSSLSIRRRSSLLHGPPMSSGIKALATSGSAAPPAAASVAFRADASSAARLPASSARPRVHTGRRPRAAPPTQQ